MLLFSFLRSFLENEGPLMEDSSKKSGVTAQQFVHDLLSATGDRQAGKIGWKRPTGIYVCNASFHNSSKWAMRKILQQKKAGEAKS